MNICCTKNPDHHNFSVTAHVAETWKVDHRGNFLEVLESGTDVVHSPDAEDSYTCQECGAEAVSKEW